MSQATDRLPTADEVMRQIADTRTARREAREAETFAAFVDTVEAAALLIDAALNIDEPRTLGEQPHGHR